MLVCAIVIASPSWAQQVIRLSTTTSTENSGLLQYLLPKFEAKSGLKVQVIAVGTGKALELAKNGDVDVTLVHARTLEDKFVARGYGVERRDVMFNDFVLVGPKNDPAKAAQAKNNILDGLSRIIESKAKFISRGDNSGTHEAELSYWDALGKKPEGKAYLAAGMGMGKVLTMASELSAYTLSDRATWAAYRARGDLAVVVEGDPRMFNPYGIIAVNPARHKGVNYQGAMQLIDWMTSGEGQHAIAEFKVDGKPVFFVAKPSSPYGESSARPLRAPGL